MESINFSNPLFRKILLAGGLLSATYVFYLMYQFQTYGWWVVKWHTHLAFPVILFGIGALFLGALGIIIRKPFTKTLHKWLFVCWVLSTAEIILMLSGVGVWLGDEPWGRFVGTQYLQSKPSKYYHWTPNSQMTVVKPEFTQKRRINSLGYVDYEWSKENSDSNFKVICLGDSFTEGEGVSFQDSYVSHLRKLWTHQAGKKVTIMNAGVSGSDPFYNYIDYKERLSVYTPDLIIQIISTQDAIQDYYWKGGLERFESKIGFKLFALRAWQAVYASSYIVRTTLEIKYKLTRSTNSTLFERFSKKSDQAFLELFSAWKNLQIEAKFTLIVIVLPLLSEIEQDNFERDITALQIGIREMNLPIYNMKNCYILRTNSGNDIQEYFWPMDLHHNAKGYQMMASCIYEGLTALGLAGSSLSSSDSTYSSK
jgi:lysophospholipase L1-like esterase